MTAYRQQKNCNTQISASRRIDLGGNSVDDEYLTLLSQIFTEAVLGKMKLECVRDYNDILPQFESTKRYFTSKRKKISITIPHILVVTYETLMEKSINDGIRQSKYKDSVTIHGNKLRILVESFQQLYKRLCVEVISEIGKMLHDNESTPISAFFLVGGVANSAFVQEFIKEAFPEVQILVPFAPDEIVRKGALQLFLKDVQPPVVTRVCRYTYGIRVQPLFNESIHDRTKIFYLDGVFRCRDVFDAFVRTGEPVSDKPILREVKTIRKRQRYVEITVVSSKRKDPQYVDEPDCIIVGKISLFVGDAPVGRVIKVSFDFSGTELSVEAEDKELNQMVKASFSFLR